MSLNLLSLLLGSIAVVLASVGLVSRPAAAQSSVLGDPNANPTGGDVRQNEVVQGSGVSAQDLIRNIMLAPSQSMSDFDSQQSGRINNEANEFLRRSREQQQMNNGGNGSTGDRPDASRRN